MTAPDIHIHPIRDLVAHTLDADCVCGPLTVHMQDLVTGETWWLIRHHALDQRDVHQRTADEKAGIIERAVRRLLRRFLGRGWQSTPV